MPRKLNTFSLLYFSHYSISLDEQHLASIDSLKKHEKTFVRTRTLMKLLHFFCCVSVGLFGLLKNEITYNQVVQRRPETTRNEVADRRNFSLPFSAVLIRVTIMAPHGNDTIISHERRISSAICVFSHITFFGQSFALMTKESERF